MSVLVDVTTAESFVDDSEGEGDVVGGVASVVVRLCEVMVVGGVVVVVVMAVTVLLAVVVVEVVVVALVVALKILEYMITWPTTSSARLER